MVINKRSRFSDSQHVFACPICHEALSYDETFLKCEEGHVFDLAKFGYVNLAPQAKSSDNYDKTSFKNRQKILENGYYRHIYEAIKEVVHRESLTQLLDVACGEGYYSRCLSDDLGLNLFAFDLSKESILLASKADKTYAVKWFVGDLTQLPIQDKVMDGILDIFSPAHYKEFNRVLKDDGLVIKLVPGPNHLKELRRLAQNQLQKADYDQHRVVNHFAKFYPRFQEQLVSQTYPISPEDLRAFVEMTPLFFHVDSNLLNLDSITEVTVEAVLLIGYKENR